MLCGDGGREWHRPPSLERCEELCRALNAVSSGDSPRTTQIPVPAGDWDMGWDGMVPVRVNHGQQSAAQMRLGNALWARAGVAKERLPALFWEFQWSRGVETLQSVLGCAVNPRLTPEGSALL